MYIKDCSGPVEFASIYLSIILKLCSHKSYPIALLRQFHCALRNKNKKIKRKPLKNQGLRRWWAILDLN